MKNVTITLDEETARWARMHAAKNNISLSRFVGDMLRRNMQESRTYNEAMRKYLNSGLVIHRLPHERAARDELHDRVSLRGKPE